MQNVSAIPNCDFSKPPVAVHVKQTSGSGTASLGGPLRSVLHSLPLSLFMYLLSFQYFSPSSLAIVKTITCVACTFNPTNYGDLKAAIRPRLCQCEAVMT